MKKYRKLVYNFYNSLLRESIVKFKSSCQIYVALSRVKISADIV